MNPKNDALDSTTPATMKGVHLVGHGGLDQLVYCEDIPTPKPKKGEVLLKVLAAGVNNTDINTRIGWYSKQVTGDTSTGANQGYDELDAATATWSGSALQLPRIQGADVCGEVVSVGAGVSSRRIGERVIVRTMQQDPYTKKRFDCVTFGSEYDGGFAQYTCALSDEAYVVNTPWSDVELASIPCAYSTAENMLHRADLKSGERVLIMGASGGVGSAAVQLAKRRGAYVIAVAGITKHDDVRALGADQLVARGDNLITAIGADNVDLVIDLVAGPDWPQLLDVLCRGGRYAVSGAIAGPMVELDIRTLYLKDLTFFGCTFQDPIVFSNLVSYIEAEDIRPVVARSYPLTQIHKAQTDFLNKGFTGKLVLVPEI
jgi:NADPH:quinone reductase-like Zn-dependent oxidoreductase|tara:strand:- start:139 stop:1257 length:1119 start_codon:yes stop_codon:yes gene_type:complete